MKLLKHISTNLKKTVLPSFLVASFWGLAQTDYQEVPLESTPITVTERIENGPSPSSNNEADTSIPPASASSGAGNGSGITETQGFLSVSLTGGANYTIPIMVPPGINGVVPQIAISYDSQNGNGVAGYGWNLSGVSTITRIPSTKYHDGIIDPVDFDLLDRFALDGQRLVLKSGTYGKNGAVYQTENYSNIKIVSYGTSPYGAAYGPEKFKVSYPDGSVAWYGSTANSRSRKDYAITFWQNPQGVLMEYSYSTSDNTLSIASIKYGHRTGTTAPNSINFQYLTRKRPEQAYIGGIDFRRKNILSQINVKTGATGYRNYVLSHEDNDLGYQRVSSIVEKSGDNSLSHSRIYFDYEDTGNDIISQNQIETSLNVAGIEQRNASVIPLDYTGNGKMDFIVSPKDKADRTKVWIFRDLQSGSSNIGAEVTTTRFEKIFPVSYLNAVNQLDAAQGFGLITHSGSNQVTFRVNGRSGTNIATQHYAKSWSAPSYSVADYCGATPYTYRVSMEYVSGDFNGDGLSDVLAISRPYSYTNCRKVTPPPGENCDGDDGDPPQPIADEQTITYNTLPSGDCCECTTTSRTSSTAYFVDLDRRKSTNFVNTAGGLSVPLSPNHKLYTADVDGDGKTDLLQVTPGKVYVYSTTANNTLQLLWSTTDSRIKTEYRPMFGDYNGDGKTDFLLPTATNSTTFALFRSTGKQFTKTESVYPFRYKLSSTTTSPATTYNLVPTDVNNDGRTDILEYKTVTNNSGQNGSQTIGMYFNTFSTATTVTPKFQYIREMVLNSYLNHFPIPVFLTSVDGENENLDFATISNNRVFSFSFEKDNRKELLLRKVTNNGVNYEIGYVDMDEDARGIDNDQIYFPKTGLTYPYVDIAVALGTKIVSHITRQRSGTPIIKQRYSYQGGVGHAEGLGFIGFKGRAGTDWHTGNSDRIWNISKHDMAKRGAMTLSYSIPYTLNFNSVPSDYISRTDYSYGSSLASNKVYKLWNTSSTAQNRLNGTTITTSYLYDAYNNPTRISTDYNGDGSSVINYTYYNNGGAAYVFGRPLTRKETVIIGTDSFSSEEQYTYTGYLLTTKKTKGNGTAWDTETFTYDVFGNVKTTTGTPNGATARQQRFDYDPSGRYLIKSYDVEGRTTEYQYNTTTGTTKKEIDSYGLVTEFFYDKWDRLIRMKDYLGKEANTIYTESGNSYTVALIPSDGGSMVTVYDPLKRIVKESSKNVLGEWVHKSYEYDKFDRVSRESQPYKGNAPNQWSSTEFDFYGRPKTVTDHTGRVTSMNYSGLSVTVNDGTKTMTTTKDAMGNVIRSTDPGGTIDYTYYGNGALKRSNFGGVVLNMEQDGWGRKTKLIDPSAGTYTYEYNGFGEITRETTPKGATEYTYSTAGRMTQKKITGDAGTNMTMAYSYNSDKLLSTVTLTNADGNNGSTTYSYDSKKRLTTIVEANPYARFTKRITYDGFGRVNSEENEAQLLSNNKTSKTKIKNTYAYGQLLNVNDYTTGEELWKITGTNDRGQVTTSTMGNGLRRTNKHDSYGYLTEVLAQKNVNASPSQLMKLTYEFDAKKGTLKNRSNSLFNWNETFTYDDLDRLVTFNDNDGAKDQGYDGKGRISTMSQLGTFSYSGNSFQPTEVDFNTAGQANYTNYTQQNVTYNAFKSPVEIKETGKEHISFQYNADENRAHTFYGDTNEDVLQRRFRRHYSADGSMEISWDKNTGKTSFVTYIGGDAYSAPAIRNAEHNGSNVTEQYLYLHRDYLGSILAITDTNGNFKEKRHFDAWGNIVKWTDGSNNNISKGFASGGILDRGYTGHEHLFGLNLVHMNGRLYDPMLHRFLMPDNFVQDPFNTQNYNRYSYVLNNPLRYVDPSGEYGAELGIGLAIALYTVIGAAAAVGIYAILDSYIDAPSGAEPANKAPTPSSGQKSSENIASSMGPPEGQIHNLEVPLGVESNFSLSTFNNSLSFCPKCDMEFIFSYAVVMGAQNAATKEFERMIAVATGRRGNQDFLPSSDVYSIGSVLKFGNGFPTHPKGGRSRLDIVYEFSQDFVVDADGNTVVSGINKIFVEANSELNNITHFERIRHDTNNTGGNRPEGLLRFYNSAGRVNVNLNFPRESSAIKFWDFYFTQVYSSTLEGLLKKYDRENGTNHSNKY